jgi:hypothetical protein
MNRLPALHSITVLFFIINIFLCCAAVAEDFTRELQQYPYNLKNTTVIGMPSWAEIRQKDTLLDVARRYDLSYYNELEFI